MRVVAVIAVLAIVTAACTETVAGRGTVAAEVVVPPAAPATRPPAPAPPPTPTASVPSSSPAALTVPAAFAGTWSGAVRPTSGAVGTWTVVLVLRAGRSLGSFLIVGRCGGVASVHGAGRTRLVLLGVLLDDPGDRCATSGTITLDRGSGRLTLSWVVPGPGGETASGVLTRT